ncbi:MAG: hypothetical protein ABI305_01065 [Tepidiformaceae bacterium]
MAEQQHPAHTESDPSHHQPVIEPEQLAPEMAPAVAMRAFVSAGAPPLKPSVIAGLQRSAGNRAVSQMLANRGANSARLQRHTEGTELPNKDQHVAEIQEKAAPSKTRSAEDTALQKGAALTEGAGFQGAPVLTRGAMSLASAQKILQGEYGDVKTIVTGTIQILADQPACSAKYDEVCIAAGFDHGDRPWAAGDCAADDAALGVQTEGFEFNGIVYVNGKTTLVTATAHEILHSNTASDFRAAVGETFNEGVTETLARKSLTAAGITVPSVTAYPDQIKITDKLKALVTEEVLRTAYFGGSASLIAKYEELKGPGTWATLKGHAEALDEVKVTADIAAPKIEPASTASATPTPTAVPTGTK